MKRTSYYLALRLAVVGFCLFGMSACSKDDTTDTDESIPQSADLGLVVKIDENDKANGNHSFWRKDEYTFYVDDIEYTLRNKNERDSILSVTSYDVSFKGDANIISVLIYHGKKMIVEEIHGEAFYNCKTLETVTIPNSVIDIDVYAFWNCTNLTSAIIGDGVTQVIHTIFDGCEKLKVVSLGRNVKIFEGFYNCISLMDLYCYAETPPYVDSITWPVDGKNLTLHVPSSCVDIYKQTKPWNRIENIVPIK